MFIDRNYVIILNKIILFVDIIIYGNLMFFFEILRVEWSLYYNGLICDYYFRLLFLYRYDYRLINFDSVLYIILWFIIK